MTEADANTPEEAGGRNLPVLVEDPPGGEIVDAQPVTLVRRIAGIPEPVVVAAGGFLAGVATFVLVRILRRGSGSRRVSLRRGGRRSERREVAASRSFLVDIHLLKR